jgi:NadR type nicotinamide-nucleotide adenylyltransferase
MEENTQRSGSRFRNGLIIGKFMPLTTGHCHLIETAQQQCEQLTILVCSLRAEPIDGHLRFGWVRDTFPAAHVLHVTDEVPSYPHQHPDFWNIWRDLILRRVPVVDAVFTGEDYGNRLAAELGAQHVMMDRTHSAIPISATQVRADPVRHWQFIPAAVRPFYVRRVRVYGPESTGKTTLCRELAAHYNSAWVPEFARAFYDEKGMIPEAQDVPKIVAGQMAIEEEAALQANGVLFCDTDVLTTVLYARHYYETCPLWIERLAHERRYDLTLLTDIDLPWEPDVQRELGERREEFYALFRDELESRRIPYVPINGNGRARLDAAIRAVENLLSLT